MEIPCPTCDGKGEVQKTHKIIIRNQTPDWVSRMPNTDNEVCKACEGYGVVEKE